MARINLSISSFAASEVFRGQRDPANAPGPTEASANVSSPYGTSLATTGSTKIYVDAAATGAADGTSLADAYTTIQAAVNTATAGDVIIVKGGTYREAVELKTNGTEASPIVLTRYGTERPVISGAKVLSGWTACSNQADALGSPQWANCYKAFVPNTAEFDGSGLSADNGINLGLLQDGAPLRLAINGSAFSSLDRMFNRKNDAWFWAGTSGNATSLVNASAAAEYSSFSDLTHAYACAHFDTGNNVDIPKITNFNSGTNTFTIETSDSSHDGDMAVLNAGVDLTTAGQWCFSDTLEGDGTRKVVVYPLAGADLSASEAEIEYCDEWHGVSIQDHDWWTVYGIDCYGVAGQSQFKGIAFGSGAIKPSGSANNGSVNEGIHFEECKASYCMSSGAFAAGFRIDGAQKCSVINCTAYEIEGQGIAMSPGATGAASNDNLIFGNHISRMHVGGVRPHVQTRTIVAYNTVTDIQSSHANGMSFYIDCRDMLIHGNIVRTTAGIGMTHQESTNLWFMFNDVQSPPDEASGRGLENNGRNPEEVNGTQGVIVYLNNTSGPASTGTSASAMIAGKTANTRHWGINNVAHGGIDPIDDGGQAVRNTYSSIYQAGALNELVEFSANVSTDTTGIGATFENEVAYDAGTAPDYFANVPKFTGNVVNTTLSAVFANVAAADYRPVSSGPLDGTGINPATHADAGDLLPDLTGWRHSGYDYQRDVMGLPVTWSSLNIGAYRETA